MYKFLILLQIVTGSTTNKLPECFDHYIGYGSKNPGVLEYNYGAAAYCSYYLGYCVNCYFNGTNEKVDVDKLYTKEDGPASVKLDYYYIIGGRSQSSQFFEIQFWNDFVTLQKDVYPRNSIYKMGVVDYDFGCAVRYTDYSFIYIQGQGLGGHLLE